ncbi:MAG: hypothetical protein FWF60_05075 [Oscillospiraceae bacterium]|nr:hypothetical protein [Oscillospiraceae bacterium]
MFWKKKTPAIEDHINGMKGLSAEQKSDILDFVAWLKGCGCAPRKDGEQYCWKVPFNGSNICKMWLNPKRERVYISFFLSYSFDADGYDDGFRATVQKNVQHCHRCHEGCTGPRDVPIFGKALKNVCSQHTINFTLPDKGTFEHIKTLVEYCKTIQPSELSYHAQH